MNFDLAYRFNENEFRNRLAMFALSRAVVSGIGVPHICSLGQCPHYANGHLGPEEPAFIQGHRADVTGPILGSIIPFLLLWLLILIFVSK